MLFQMEEITDQISLRIPEIKPEIAFQTVEITVDIESITVLTVVEIAFHIVSKNDLIASSMTVTTALIVSQVVVIFSCAQSITLLMITWIASKIVSNRYRNDSSSGDIMS